MFSISSTNPDFLRLRAQSTPYWSSGSFLYLLASEVRLQIFDDFDLLAVSQSLALESLLEYLDFLFPVSASFLSLRSQQLKLLAKDSLEGGAGQRFWCENSRHVQHDEFLEMYGVTEYPDYKAELIAGVWALLEMAQPRMKTFLEERARAASLGITGGRESEGEEAGEDDSNVVEEPSLQPAAPGSSTGKKRKRDDDDDDDDDDKPQKRQMTTTLALRTKA